MSGRSVNLTTLLLGRLRPMRLTSTSCTYFPQLLTIAFLESAEGEMKSMWLERASNPGHLAHESDALPKLPYLFDYMYMIVLFNSFFLLQKSKNAYRYLSQYCLITLQYFFVLFFPPNQTEKSPKSRFIIQMGLFGNYNLDQSFRSLKIHAHTD